MKMKRMFAVGAAVVIVGTMAACNGNKEDSGISEEKKAESIDMVQESSTTDNITDETADAETEASVPEESEPEESEPVELYGWENLAGEYVYRSGENLDITYKVTIDNVAAASEAESDVTFDLEFQNAAGEVISVSGQGISNNNIYFEGSIGTDKWNVSLSRMSNGALDLYYDGIGENGGFDFQGMNPAILTKEAAEPITDLIGIEEGTYIYTTGSDVYYDGGAALDISNVSGEPGHQNFSMLLSIISDGGEKVDETEVEIAYTEGNMATFWGISGWENYVIGYLMPQADGSIAMIYEVTDENPDMAWYGAYPDYATEPVILTKAQ